MKKKEIKELRNKNEGALLEMYQMVDRLCKTYMISLYVKVRIKRIVVIAYNKAMEIGYFEGRGDGMVDLSGALYKMKTEMKKPEEWAMVTDKMTWNAMVKTIQNEAWNSALDALKESKKGLIYKMVGKEYMTLSIEELEKMEK